MDINVHLKKALELAIQDYNQWASEEAGGYNPIAAYGDLRGIFFNKLLARLKDVPGLNIYANRLTTRLLVPGDLKCEVTSSCFLVHVDIAVPDSISTQRGQFLIELSKACRGIDFKAKPIAFEANINDIINSIKSFKL